MHSILQWDANSFLYQDQELVKKAIDERATYNTAELERIHPCKKGVETRRRLGVQVAFNMHTMGISFVEKVRDVRQIAEAQIGEGVAKMVEFKAQVNGHEATEKASRIQVCQDLLDWQLVDRIDKDRTVLMMMISFITINSGLVPLIEGLCAQILYFIFQIIGGLRSLLWPFFVGRKIVLEKKATSPRSHPAS